MLMLMLLTLLLLNAAVMRSATHPATTPTSTPYHHLHHTLVSATLLPPTDPSFRQTTRTTSPLLVANRAHTGCPMQCRATLRSMVARLIPIPANIPPMLIVEHTTDVGAAAPPLTRWSSAALPMKQPVSTRTPSTGSP